MPDLAEETSAPDARGRAESVGRILLAFLLAGLAAFSARLYREDASERARLEAMARRFTLDLRHPGAVQTIAVAPAADLAIAPLVTAVLDDALSPRALRGLSPVERRRWLEAILRLDELMGDLEGRLARASIERPGWPYHRILRGQLAFVRARRSASSEPLDRWWRPLSLGVEAAPGDDGPAVFLSGAALESWDSLTDGQRRVAHEAFRQAFHDAGFLNGAVAVVERRLGGEETLALLPDTAAAVKAAFRATAAAPGASSPGGLSRAVDLYRRWEQRERDERRRDLARVEERFRRGDVGGVRRLCESFLAAHPAADLDDAESRRQLARLLALWPAGVAGTFTSDPRAGLVRHLLDGRTDGVDGRAMARALDDLPDAPDHVRAAAWLLAGDAYELERLVRRNEASTTLEWAPVWLLAVRRRLAARDLEGATEAMARVARPALEECEGLLVRRLLAERLGQPEEAVHAQEAIRALGVNAVPGGGETRLALCYDPESPERVVRLGLSGTPALVSWGFDGARSGLVATLIGTAPGNGELILPLWGQAGRRILSLRVEGGGPVRVETYALAEK